MMRKYSASLPLFLCSKLLLFPWEKTCENYWYPRYPCFTPKLINVSQYCCPASCQNWKQLFCRAAKATTLNGEHALHVTLQAQRTSLQEGLPSVFGCKHYNGTQHKILSCRDNAFCVFTSKLAVKTYPAQRKICIDPQHI